MNVTNMNNSKNELLASLAGVSEFLTVCGQR